MLTYRVPIAMNGVAVLKLRQGEGFRDYAGGLPSDAEYEICLNTPFVRGARMGKCTVELAGGALMWA